MPASADTNRNADTDRNADPGPNTNADRNTDAWLSGGALHANESAGGSRMPR